MISMLIRCLVLVSFACSVLSQRTWSFAVHDDEATGNFFLNDSGSASAMWAWTIGSTSGGGNVSLPSPIVGGACLVGPDRLLVAGLSGAQGWLAEVVFAVSGSGVAASVGHISIGSVDLCQITYLPGCGMIIGVNDSDDSLLAATYQPGLALGTWQPIATPTTCSVLAAPTKFVSLNALPGGLGVHVQATEIFQGMGSFEVVQTAPGQWSIVDLALAAPPASPPPTWLVSAYPELNSTSTEYLLWIGGGSGSFSIVDVELGVAVWQGTHGGAQGGEVFSIPIGALQLGRAYAVDSGAGSAYSSSTPFRAESIWPRSSVGANMVPSRVGIRWDFPVVGSDFASWQLYWIGSAPQPSDPVLLTMMVGPWDFGVNPTVPVLGVEMLAAPFGDLGARVATWDNTGCVSFGWAFAVNNPAFVGIKVAMQAVGVLPTGQIIVSDVAGVELVQ